ncbi:MAG TPA: TonB family protein [Arenicellales bacterium]|nr:TonB family protein [Arenicellales bacterium]
MQARTAQLVAMTVSLAAHAALLAGISNTGLFSGTATTPRAVVVSLEMSPPAAPGGGLPPAVVADESPAPEPEAAPGPELLPATEAPASAAAEAQPVLQARTGTRDSVPVGDRGEVPAQPEPVQVIAREPIESVTATEVRQEPGQEGGEAAPTASAAASEAAPAASGWSAAGERERYLSELLAHIEANKRYPRAARRRRLEGDVAVQFTLLGDGSIRKLRVESGPAVLRAAARSTLDRAMPLPSPPQSVGAPLPVRYAMRFRLN